MQCQALLQFGLLSSLTVYIFVNLSIYQADITLRGINQNKVLTCIEVPAFLHIVVSTSRERRTDPHSTTQCVVQCGQCSVQNGLHQAPTTEVVYPGYTTIDPVFFLSNEPVISDWIRYMGNSHQGRPACHINH